MLKRHKELLRALVGELRRTLAGSTDANGNKIRGDLDRELERLGIAENGRVTPVDALINPTAQERRTNAVAAAELNRGTSREEVVERAAYTWINRLLALRAMEARSLIDETLRANPDYEGLSEALFVLRQTEPGRTTGADAGWWAVFESACAVQAEALPGLFDLADPNAGLRPSTQSILKCIKLVGGQQPGFTLEESDAAFADPDAIGWAYQFYQEAKKAETYAKLGKGGKASTRAEIAAVTQLFTEPYMVQWLLQNSLGRSYHELFPDSQLPAQWAYYIKPEKLDQPAIAGLVTLSLMDPCVGSGHFLREAFDMFAAMYREQQPDLNAVQIADNIFERHLHGIDLDPRAVQLATFTLYLRAWELIRDERRRERQSGPGSYRPSRINLATTPTGLSQGSLERHLQRHPEDRLLKPILQGIFESLEQAEILGSLLRPGEHLVKAIASMQGTYNIPLDPDPTDMALRRSIMEMAKHNPTELRRMLMDRIAASFQTEAQSTDDVASSLFGREASEGVRLLKLLDHKYAVVVTNPPYMGSGNMDIPLRKYVEKYYKSGKRDLYAAFILRCLELCNHNGRIAMIPPENWMFLQSFSEFRFSIKDKENPFRGLLLETTFEALTHLGRHAFSESDAPFSSVMIVLKLRTPEVQSNFWGCRLTASRPSEEQAGLLLKASKIASIGELDYVFMTNQNSLLDIPDCPVIYWVSSELTNLLKLSKFQDIKIEVKPGIITGSNEYFLRYIWEIRPASANWTLYLKGGGYQKWRGFEYMVLNWPVKQFAIMENPVGRIRDKSYFGRVGWNYSMLARGSLSVRELQANWVYDNGSPSIFPPKEYNYLIGGILQTRWASFLLRLIAQSIRFNAYHISLLPLPNDIKQIKIETSVKFCLIAKELFLSFLPYEYAFTYDSYLLKDFSKNEDNFSFIMKLLSLLHTVEGYIEEETLAKYPISPKDITQIYDETGKACGQFPIINDYDSLPRLPNEQAFPVDVLGYITSVKRINPNKVELMRIRDKLKALFESGPNIKDNGKELESQTGIEEGEGDLLLPAHIPIPIETFLEELSVKLQIHPISVYWLLEELRAEGVRCKPEEKRLLEDRLTVLVLRLMGHRWPKQLETGEPVPDWADKDGILTLTQGAGGHEEKTLGEQVRERLRAEEGPLGAQQTEALLAELTGQNLEDWLRKTFFPRHVRQFKYRPIAWHLASQPEGAGKKKGSAKRPPAFECLLYYHVCGGDALVRIRTQYVEPLIRAERNNLSVARQNKNDTAAAISGDRLRELDEFADKLRQVEETGFDTPELEKLLAGEPLDRWSGDGYLSPTSHEELLQQERSWRVDINDGVRVNIGPLQLAGLLAGDVFKALDAKKALADRARWRSDERRWVREGKLPRCGWMSEDVQESPAWTKLAPQRAAEQQKLDLKRKTALEKVQ